MNERAMLTLEEAKRRIEAGQRLFLSGDDSLLKQLPRGTWAGGTIPYFIAEQGGLFSQDLLYAWELPAFVTDVQIKTYDAQALFDVYREAPENGFSLIVIPASSTTHLSFALNAPNYDLFAARPLIGWISGVALDHLRTSTPRVYNGSTGEALDDGAVVMHVSLPPGKTADVGIINIFEQGAGDTFVFPEDSFTVTDVIVNGERRNFAEYIQEKQLDIKLPLVADYNGAMVNISFQSIDTTAKSVKFYAPVFEGVEYRHARPVADYIQAFSSQVSAGDPANIMYSCNCILNYLYAGLEGKHTAGITGPITFGEVAYQLLNQTMVYLKIMDVNLAERLRGEVALKQRFQLLETLINTIPNPVYYKDVKGRYLGCNKAYEEFMGKHKQEIIGKTTHALWPKEMADRIEGQDHLLLQDTGHQTFEWKMQDMSGNWRNILFHKATFFGQNGKLRGLIGVMLDVTALRQTEESLEKTVAELKDTLAQVKTIKGLIPICYECKRIRVDTGSWQQLESYFRERIDSQFTHGLCEECLTKEIRRIDEKKKTDTP